LQVAERGSYDLTFGPGAAVDGREFTDPSYADADVREMAVMLDRERALAAEWAGAADAPPNASILTHDDEGRRHWLAVPNVSNLVHARDITCVGFFGHFRDDVDASPLFALEEMVVAGFPDFAEVGLLSYYDKQLENGRYGNLILFSTPEPPREWFTQNPGHEQAVVISPQHYFSIRLHKGHVPGPVLHGDGEIALERTKYLDFQDGEVWRGLRTFA
jgi:hypothetical protein